MGTGREGAEEIGWWWMGPRPYPDETRLRLLLLLALTLGEVMVAFVIVFARTSAGTAVDDGLDVKGVDPGEETTESGRADLTWVGDGDLEGSC